jgi:hypothetical protein
MLRRYSPAAAVAGWMATSLAPAVELLRGHSPPPFSVGFSSYRGRLEGYSDLILVRGGVEQVRVDPRLIVCRSVERA